jgi:tRNA modification GTPase
MNTFDDTIAAIATPIGEAGISVIRVSGPRAFAIVDRGFRGKKPLNEASTHTAHFGDFLDRRGEKIDEVVATLFRAPQSFTTEDVVEVSCHGGLYVTKAILDELINGGARSAEPGEFTKRAFLNGRIDLSQAEAVADLIHARSRMSLHASIDQLSGKISVRVARLREKILDLSSLLELGFDFSEEGIDLVKQNEMEERLTSILEEIDGMISSYEHGRIVREGVKVVLVGKPNVGKSSILNSLLDYERAIVSEIPGTTRDTLEENVRIEGLLFSLTDTAGLRESDDKVEELGMDRARSKIKNADILLFVVDASIAPSHEDLSLVRRCIKEMESHGKALLLENKVDLLETGKESNRLAELSDIPHHRISAVTGYGVDLLRNELLKIASSGQQGAADGSFMITSQRHHSCLRRALEFVQKAKELADRRLNTELIAENLNLSTKALGEIIGIVTTEDILNNIFSNFCIGK